MTIEDFFGALSQTHGWTREGSGCMRRYNERTRMIECPITALANADVAMLSAWIPGQALEAGLSIGLSRDDCADLIAVADRAQGEELQTLRQRLFMTVGMEDR